MTSTRSTGMASLAVLCLVLVLSGSCHAFSPMAGIGSRLSLRNAVSASARGRVGLSGGIRMQQEGEEDTVEISREELKALAEKAGIRVQIGNTPLDRAPPPMQAEPEGPNAFEPFINAFAALPPILKYPIFVLATGIASSVLLPLFGSSSIGEMTGRNAGSSTAAQESKPAAKADAPGEKSAKAAVKAEGGKGAKKSLFPDLGNLAPPPEQLEINRSCDKWPWSLTPTCADPEIGNKGVLKNLDQYTKPNPEVKKMREDFDNRQKAQRAAIAAEKAAKEAAKDDK